MNCFSPSELEGTPGGALWSFKSWAINSSITERFPLLNASSRTRRLLAFRSAMALPPEQLRPTKTGSHSTPGRPDLNPQLTKGREMVDSEALHYGVIADSGRLPLQRHPCDRPGGPPV